jgi:hypothetical protein
MLTLLRQKQSISLLQRNTMSRIFIIRRKPRRMRTLRHFSTGDLLQRIYALAGGIEGVHEMHGVSCVIETPDLVDGHCTSIRVSYEMSKVCALVDSPC